MEEAHLNIDLQRFDDAFVFNFIGAKLHGIYVTEANLNYHGSITIDSHILEIAQILPMEYVNIWNKNTGTRLSTYVLPGEPNSGICCLNGGAARSAQVGDEIIIATERKMTIATLKKLQQYQVPVLTFQANNHIAEQLTYCLHIRNDNLLFTLAETNSK